MILGIEVLVVGGLLLGIFSKLFIDRMGGSGLINKIMDTVVGVLFIVIVLAIISQGNFSDPLIFTNTFTGGYLAMEAIGEVLLKK